MTRTVGCVCGGCPVCRRREWRREYDAERSADPAFREWRHEYDRQRNAQRRRLGRPPRTEGDREYDRKRRRDPKVYARQAVQRAVKTGRLVRGPCERAGPDCAGRVEAHHDDYERRLDVRWLCAEHHRDEHDNGGRQ